MLKQKDILAGKYEILKQIGVGGMSRVWLAMDTKLNKQWAVKEIIKTTEEFRLTVNEDRTLTEIEILKNLDHPFLPRIVDVVDGDSLCVVMDYVEGETLLKILELYGPQDQDTVVEWMIDICEVFEYLHNHKPPIIYRDMKPSNVMLRPEGTIKIIDFGIAREYKAGHDDTQCFGTKGYASPEHFTGHTDTRSDIFTIGATMYQLLTGLNPALPPFEILPIREVNSSLSSALEKIILKATQPNPDKRYQTVTEMKRDIKNYRKLERPYIAALEKKIKKVKIAAISSAALFLLGAGLIAGGIIMDNNTYDQLVAQENPDITVRQEELQKAIGIKPGRIDAYEALIKAYAKDGFNEREASEFLITYNAKKEKLEKNTEEYAHLNFKIGQAFLLYYTGSTDDSSRNRLINAKPFFGECLDVEFAENTLAKGYYNIAEFYEKYVLGSNDLVVNDATKKDYVEILGECTDIIDNISSYEGEGAAQTCLNTYDMVLNLIDDERQSFTSKKISEEFVLGIISSIRSKASDLQSSAEVTLEKKQEVISLADEYEKRVKMTYDNHRKQEQEQEAEDA